MSGDGLTTYNLWDMTLPSIPTRSRLDHLDPISVGTPHTESLTGYIARLADAHSVTPRTLIVRELMPLLQTTHLSRLTSGGSSSFWWGDACALNGTQTQAKDWVQALETLTLRNDLRFLTFLPWTAVLSPKHLLRRTRAWCPSCYDEWRHTGQVVYDPLLWAVAAVTGCLRHRRHLRLQCRVCGRPLPILASRARLGYCPHCHHWLGTPLTGASRLDDNLSDSELASQVKILEAIGALIAAAPGLPVVPPSRKNVVQAVSTLVHHLGAGKAAALARRISLPKSMVSRWHRGKAVPRLDSLLRLCWGLGITPLDFFTSEGRLDNRSRLISAPVNLLQAPSPPPRAPLVATRVQGVLMHVLECEDSPPPSMREVARRLGSAPANLYHRFPELCRAISARFQAYRKAQSLERRQQRCKEVREATCRLYREGVYPSHDRVEALLSLKAALRLPALKAARIETLIVLGVKRRHRSDAVRTHVFGSAGGSVSLGSDAGGDSATN